ncbi:3-dehydroquinate dehydratase [Dehalogenimonas lykanthroporepellens BL-DC-9]|jgi:3-dehydroquinate dehydratase type I|nr:3-dehydroquinate dehydratase [Dehalogenimonas lykanthroporepellens BL-DC-9]
MKPAVCTVVTSAADLSAAIAAEPLTTLYEVRIDLIGEAWPEVARRLGKPWIGCARLSAEGGAWRDSETRRRAELLRALELGAAVIDVELATPNLGELVAEVKKRARCLISHHDYEKTPSSGELKSIVGRELAAGADICKLVTRAVGPEDNLALLRLYQEFQGCRLVAFGMGQAGLLSRVLAPLAGAEFTYAAVEPGRQSAPGQLTAAQITEIYGITGL